MDEKKIQEFIELVARIGRVVVAQDVYAALQEYEQNHPGTLAGLSVQVSQFLSKGAALALDEYLVWPGTGVMLSKLPNWG